ncbi:hypothetical protein E2C01_089226 [Portunus trituberculatus]|uniref:Uncharacterized protein n=1 Tax=Portunus trituberculatus TaxID=210409 RepID=A0A5B7JHK3_PORTR|nr:hypothetical protein [Portunus trituberculatus]
MVWMGCVLSTVRFSGSTSLREPSSRSMKRSLPCNIQPWLHQSIIMSSSHWSADVTG